MERRAGRRILLMAAASAIVGRGHAAEVEVRVVLGDDGPAVHQIRESLQRVLKNVVMGADVLALARRSGPGVYVAVGPLALKRVLDSTASGPVLSLFTSRATYQAVRDATTSSAQRAVTAIYAEPSPSSQFVVARALHGGRRVAVGVLLSADSAARMMSALQRTALENGVELQVQVVDRGDEPVRALNRLHGISALVVMPDKDLYTPDGLRNLLAGSYRRRVPLIGYSAQLATAGAIAAPYSSIDDIVSEAARTIPSLASGITPVPSHPLYWRVSINESVARSLDITVDDRVRALGNFPP